MDIRLNSLKKTNTMPTIKKIWVAGHQGMVGAALLRQIKQKAEYQLITADRSVDLRCQQQVNAFLEQEKPDQIIIAAAKVGGIQANNTYPAEFIYDNLMIQSHIIHQAYQVGCQQLLFLGSSCIYPKLATQPMAESALLTGTLEPTNEPYAIAKIAGIKMCESYNRQYGVDFRSLMPTNLYGPLDNFHPENSHVIPAMLRRFHQARCEQKKQVTVWGSGTPCREFLHVDDMARACLHILSLDKATLAACTDPMLSHINIGTGVDCSIAELANTIKQVVGFTGEIVFNPNQPDGVPRKLLNIDKLKQLNFTPQDDLKTGLEHTYTWFLENLHQLRL